MIRNFLSKFFHRKRTGRKSLPSPRRYRRITIEPLETRRLLAATGSISGFIYLDPANAGTMTSGDAGFAGMTVELQSVGSSGSTTLVSPGGIATTGTDGSYSFTGVAAGTYQVQITPSPQLDVGTLSPGSAGGTAGTNEIQLTLTAGQAATDYNFALLGANPSYISARMDLATTGTLGNYLSNSVLTPPTVQSTGSNGASGTTYSTSYTAGGTPVNVCARRHDQLDGKSESVVADRHHREPRRQRRPAFGDDSQRQRSELELHQRRADDLGIR